MVSTIIAAVAAIIAIVAVVWALRVSSSKSEPDLQSVRADLTSAFGAQLQAMQTGVQGSLNSVMADVGTRLDAINRQVADRLNENATALRSGSKEVNDRI